MRGLLVFCAIGFGVVSGAQAGMSCQTDFYGNYVCNGTGNNSGYRTSTTTDFYGNDVTTDNRGNRMSCSTDFYGNYVCN